MKQISSISTHILQIVRSERGFSFIELLVSLPAILLLTLALMTMFFFCLKSYVYELSDWVLQDEIRTAMSRIVHDLKYATGVEKNGPVLYIKIHKNGTPQQEFVTYERTDKMMHPIARSNQPITGHSKLSSVYITKFYFKIEDGGKMPNRVHVELVGENLMTKHVFALETTVNLKRMH